ARAEGRLVLTRDRGLAARRAINAVLIRIQALDEQIEQVVAEVDLPPEPVTPRCAVCNVPLVPVEPSAVRDRVPPYVARTETVMSVWGQCQRADWPGSHWRYCREKLDEAEG